MISSDSCHHVFVKYRLRNKPDEAMCVYDPFPVIPAVSVDRMNRAHRFIHDYHREIAWTVDYRGEDDNIPTLLFVGAGYTLVKKVIRQMFEKGSSLFSALHLYRDYYIYQRQAKAWVRIAVELKGYKNEVMRIEDLGEIIVNILKRECLCNIRYVKLKKFLNL